MKSSIQKTVLVLLRWPRPEGVAMRARHKQTIAVHYNGIGNCGHFFHGVKIQ